MSTWVVALKCFEFNFLHYPTEVCLLNTTDNISYSYHIRWNNRYFKSHPYGYLESEIKSKLRQVLKNPNDILFVCDQNHLYMAKLWFPNINIRIL